MADKGEKSHPHKVLEQYRPDLKPFEKTYQQLHQDPELPYNEASTAKICADHLKSLDFAVQEGIGGTGLVGVLENGDGPKILLRSELDALPMAERTDLPYASKKTMKDKLDGETKSVMHACGHDMHMACLMAVATLLKNAREHWSGTLICVFQPAEELLSGAQAMIDDGLFDKVPTPDIILGEHVLYGRTGTVIVKSGYCLTACDTFKVRVFGRGGHGAAPHQCVDPVLMACNIVVRLQGIVSREVTPGEMAVVTVGSIHGGTAANIVPDHVDLQVDVRTVLPEIRKKVLAAIERIITGECDAAGATQKPVFQRIRTCPAIFNDEEATGTLIGAFKEYFGESLREGKVGGASDDFAVYREATGKPSVFWDFGGTDAAQWDDAESQGKISELIPGNHSSKFYPVIQPTLRTGVDALALAALTFFKAG